MCRLCVVANYFGVTNDGCALATRLVFEALVLHVEGTAVSCSRRRRTPMMAKVANRLSRKYGVPCMPPTAWQQHKNPPLAWPGER